MANELTQELEEVIRMAITRAETAAKAAEKAAKAAQNAADKLKLAKQKIKSYIKQIANVESDNSLQVDEIKEEVLDIVKKAAKKNKALKKIAKLNLESKKKKK